MSRHFVRINTEGMGCLSLVLVYLFVFILWAISFAASILASSCLVYLMWLLGRFLLGGVIS